VTITSDRIASVSCFFNGIRLRRILHKHALLTLPSDCNVVEAARHCHSRGAILVGESFGSVQGTCMVFAAVFLKCYCLNEAAPPQTAPQAVPYRILFLCCVYNITTVSSRKQTPKALLRKRVPFAYNTSPDRLYQSESDYTHHVNTQ
jgi:hypothetical protein